MPEYVADPHRECPSCSEEYRSPSQHWAKSQCPYPQISAAMHAAVEGLLVGDGSVDGRAHAMIEVQSARREHILFCHDQLGALSRGVTRTERSDMDGPLYRLRTHAHPALDRYWQWADGPPEETTLSRRGVRVWFACDGYLDFGGRDDRPLGGFRAVGDGRRATVVRLLRSLPIPLDVRALPRAGRVHVPADDVPRLLRYLGLPTPGSVHKWCLARAVYRRVRDEGVFAATDALADRYKALLLVAADALVLDRASLSPEHFESAIAAPPASAIADHLGGGSWTDALGAAGVPPGDRPVTGTAAISSDHSDNSRNSPGPPTRYPPRACRHALVRVASHLDTDCLSMDDYDRARREVEPAARTVANTLGNGRWTPAVATVGLGTTDPRSGETTAYSRDEIDRALTAAAEAVDGRLTMVAYQEWAAQHDRRLPGVDMIANRLGDGSWAIAVERAGHTPGAKGRRYHDD